MMAPHIYEQARRNAPIHVQIWRPRIRLERRDANAARVNGRVVRIFRDDERALRWGQRISFTVPVIDRVSQPAPSGTIFHAWEMIGPARFLEAFLESWNGEIHLVYSQLAPIRRPTLVPVCDPSQEGFLCRGNI